MKHELKNPHTKLSFNNMLDRMWERKIQGLLSDKSLQHVENAYFICRPVQTASQVREDNTTEAQKKMKHLLFECLNEQTADEVVKKLTRFNLESEDDKEYLYDTILRFAQQGTYTDLDNISYVLSKFSKLSLKKIQNKIIENL